MPKVLGEPLVDQVDNHLQAPIEPNEIFTRFCYQKIEEEINIKTPLKSINAVLYLSHYGLLHQDNADPHLK